MTHVLDKCGSRKWSGKRILKLQSKCWGLQTFELQDNDVKFENGLLIGLIGLLN